MGDFSAHLLQIPVMLVALPQPLSNCQAQPFVLLITPEKAMGWAPRGGCCGAGERQPRCCSGTAAAAAAPGDAAGDTDGPW